MATQLLGRTSFAADKLEEALLAKLREIDKKRHVALTKIISYDPCPIDPDQAAAFDFQKVCEDRDKFGVEYTRTALRVAQIRLKPDDQYELPNEEAWYYGLLTLPEENTNA